MTFGKKRGRKPTKRTVEAKTAIQRQKHWLDCDECGLDGAEVEGDVSRFICARCVQRIAEPPDLPKRQTKEEKQAAVARKAEKAALKLAELKGETSPTKLNFGRGWHRRILFKAEVEGKTRYYSKGKEITAAKYKKMDKEQKGQVKPVKTTVGFGRGWHFKDVFMAPNGDRYEKGKLVKTKKRKKA